MNKIEIKILCNCGKEIKEHASMLLKYHHYVYGHNKYIELCGVCVWKNEGE